MTLDQGLAFGIIGAVIALLIWDKLRYDLVAMLALLAAVACLASLRSNAILPAMRSRLRFPMRAQSAAAVPGSSRR